MHTTTSDTLHALLVGPIDLADAGGPPHSGGRPCGALCVPACTTTPYDEPPAAPRPTPARGAQS